MHRWNIGLASARPDYPKRRRPALATEHQARRRTRSVTAGQSPIRAIPGRGRPSAEPRSGADRDRAVVARSVGGDLGRFSFIGFGCAGVIRPQQQGSRPSSAAPSTVSRISARYRHHSRRLPTKDPSRRQPGRLSTRTRLQPGQLLRTLAPHSTKWLSQGSGKDYRPLWVGETVGCLGNVGGLRSRVKPYRRS